MTSHSVPSRVLVVDDDASLAQFIVEILSDAGHRPEAVHRVDLARERIEREEWDLVISDLRMPGESGLDLIGWTKAYDPGISVLAITAYGSIQTAVQAVRLGAADYIPKPFEPDALLLAVDKSLRERRMRLELTSLRSAVDARYGFDGIVAHSAVMQEILGLARRVADSPSTVVITGASGVGKEVIARAIHTASRRRARPFVAVNCAAIPETLLESELFGHKKGSFTGATADKPGLFRAAHQGTLFLDEVGDLPLSLQAKLLRVLQEREVRPIGATTGEPVDVRVLAATHHELRAAVAERRFREDLFYRLAVIKITIPRLADRPEDILPLAEQFLADSNKRLGRNVLGFAGAARGLLGSYGWPGNVRELHNVVERAVNLCAGEVITPEDLPAPLHRPREENFLGWAAERQLTIADLEVMYARLTLSRTGGNKKAAARLLDIDRRTLQRWLGEREEAPAEDDESASAAATRAR